MKIKYEGTQKLTRLADYFGIYFAPDEDADNVLEIILFGRHFTWLIDK